MHRLTVTNGLIDMDHTGAKVEHQSEIINQSHQSHYS